jgi:hypothetical protein
LSERTEDSFEAFGGPTAHFNVLTPSRARRRKAAYSARHVAYGNLNVIQLGGRLEAERSYTVYLPNDGELENVDQCLGMQGTLNCAETGGVTAALVSYDASTYFTGGQQIATLMFVCDAD